MLGNPLICRTICECLWRMSSGYSRLHNGSIINGRLTGICNPGTSIHAGKKVIKYVPLNQWVCPNPSVQWNSCVNQFHPPMQKHQLRGQGSPLLYQSPVERPPTVLAHKDLAVGTFGVHDISCGPGHSFKSST